MYREEQSHTQPHFHANPRLTRRISLLSCSTTMQGPSHAPKQSNHRFCPHGKSIARRASIQQCCQPDNAILASPATKGYVGLHNSPPCPSRMHRMHQFAQIVERSCCRSVTIPGLEKANYRINHRSRPAPLLPPRRTDASSACRRKGQRETPTLQDACKTVTGTPGRDSDFCMT